MSGDQSMSVSGTGDAALPSTSRSPESSKLNERITYCEPLMLSQLWRIENFHTILKSSRSGQCFRSHVFRDQQMSDVCWQLCLYPNGKREENKDNVSLFLKMSTTTQNKEVLVKAKYHFYFLDDNEQIKLQNINIGDFHAKPPKGGHSWGLRNISKQKVAEAVRQDNSLVISCIIEVIELELLDSGEDPDFIVVDLPEASDAEKQEEKL